MICVKIQGGQGNQMFQYAIGRYLALRNDCDLQYELSYFEGSSSRNFVLDIYNTSGGKTNKTWIKIYENIKFLKPIMELIFPIYREKTTEFCEKVSTLKSANAYLIGYWIKVEYFDSIRDILKKDFMLKVDLSENALYWLSKIRNASAPTVSIHIRRGDYVKVLENKRKYKEITADYYRFCVSELEKKFGSLSIFVFSDDIEWAKLNIVLRDNEVYYVTGTDEYHGYEDMYMMWECEHHIIANSTFSWWGAYLAKYKGLTYAPKYWFNMESRKDYIEKLYPKDWIIVDR